jgi:PAS domain S-box-containing protein
MIWVRRLLATKGPPISHDPIHAFSNLSPEQIGRYIEYFPGPAFLKERDGTILALNQACIRGWGWDGMDVIGKKDVDLCPPEFIRQIRDIESRVLDEEISLQSTVTVDTPNGRRTYLTTRFPVSAPTGERWLGGIAVDTTEREESARQASEDQKRLYSVLNLMPSYVVLLKADQTVLFKNHRFLEFFSVHEARHRAFLTAAHQPIGGRDGLENILTGRETHWQWKDQQNRTFEVWAYPFRNSDDEMVVLEVGLEITERKDLQRRFLEASEQERRTLGRDLHDVIGQNLAGLSFVLESMMQPCEQKAPELSERLGQGLELAHSSLAKVRALCRGLDPVGLDGQGLAEALETLADGIRGVYDIDLQLDVPDQLELDPVRATQFYYIAMEAVTNAAKHAGATQIQIRLVRTESAWELAIHDNGVGIETFPKVNGNAGMGLRTMEYRARVIGAEFLISARNPTGTTVCCVLPVANPS